MHFKTFFPMNSTLRHTSHLANYPRATNKEVDLKAPKFIKYFFSNRNCVVKRKYQTSRKIVSVRQLVEQDICTAIIRSGVLEDTF